MTWVAGHRAVPFAPCLTCTPQAWLDTGGDEAGSRAAPCPGPSATRLDNTVARTPGRVPVASIAAARASISRRPHLLRRPRPRRRARAAHRAAPGGSRGVSLWRNRLARSAVNRKVGGSSPPRDVLFPPVETRGHRPAFSLTPGSSVPTRALLSCCFPGTVRGTDGGTFRLRAPRARRAPLGGGPGPGALGGTDRGGQLKPGSRWRRWGPGSATAARGTGGPGSLMQPGPLLGCGARRKRRGWLCPEARWGRKLPACFVSGSSGWGECRIRDS
ncbi:uncharacterized protein LOC119525202 [Choloepus didactylus]|uniref:uncharacterized protein LOC119525202 n=1 Tax=Choloepus didactylus TaxID=27675 RepID=UPI0018A10B11|nr:uncharacterized protein LOC119525202 [Choloepus didactylus]